MVDLGSLVALSGPADLLKLREWGSSCTEWCPSMVPEESKQAHLPEWDFPIDGVTIGSVVRFRS